MNPTLTRQHGRVLTGLLCAAALSACAPPPETPPVHPAVYVSVVHNSSGEVQRVLSGSLRPRIEADLSFRVGGTLTQRAVELGQAVRAGQVLARIDAADYQLALDAAIAQQQAAAVDAEQAASDAARFARLRADGSVGAADAERQQARADAAAARLAQAQQQVALARNRAGYAVLTAPFAGVVTGLSLEAGQVVGENQPVMRLARPGALELQADIPEALAAGLDRWQASVRLNRGDSITELPLRLRELAPTAASPSRTYRARYTLPAGPADAAWRIGMTAELRLTQPGASAGAELPVSALLATPGRLPAAGGGADGGPHAAVWRVDPATGALQHTPVQLLAQGSDRVSVLGLPDGALVVSVGAQKLDAGMTVRPVARPLDPPLPAAPAPATLSTARSVVPELLR